MENKNNLEIMPEIDEIPEEQNRENEMSEVANHRDRGSDEFDDGSVEGEDRIRGAGRQSLDELAIENEEISWGLEEGGGGLRSDRPREESVEDWFPSERKGA
jgi:hypothetical protein